MARVILSSSLFLHVISSVFALAFLRTTLLLLLVLVPSLWGFFLVVNGRLFVYGS